RRRTAGSRSTPPAASAFLSPKRTSRKALRCRSRRRRSTTYIRSITQATSGRVLSTLPHARPTGSTTALGPTSAIGTIWASKCCRRFRNGIAWKADFTDRNYYEPFKAAKGPLSLHGGQYRRHGARDLRPG